jgi:hypothetical protein
MSGWVVCSKRGKARVSLEVCVGVCESREDCEEYKEIQKEDFQGSLAKMNRLPTVVDDSDFREYQDSYEKKDAGEISRLLQRAISIKNEIEGKFWEMGSILNDIFKNQYYVDYGYHDWKDFCNEVLEMKWRSATYLRDIYVKFTSLGIGPEDCVGVGWAKLKELLPIVTKENVKYWLKEAKAKKVSVAVLNAKVRHALGRITKEESERLPKQLVFRLHNAQLENVEKALELARRMTGSNSRGYHLEMICAEFRLTYEATDESHAKNNLVTDLLGRIENLLGLIFKGEIVDAKTGAVIRGVK